MLRTCFFPDKNASEDYYDDEHSTSSKNQPDAADYNTTGLIDSEEGFQDEQE